MKAPSSIQDDLMLRVQYTLGDLVFAIQLFIKSPLFSFPLFCKKARFELCTEQERNNMDWSTLELKVISCRDLKAFNFFQKLSAYSVVSIIIVNEQAKKKEEQQKHLQRQKTSIQKGGKNPEWNHVFQFDLQSLPPEEGDHLFLKFDLRSEGLVDRTIGEIRVPLKDLIDEFCGVVRFVSYQVRNSDGKPNGVLNFSYKLIGRIKKSGNGSPQVDLSPETQFSSKNVVYPKLEQDNQSSGIQYPSLDDVYSPSPIFHCQTLGGYYGRNSAPQGLVPGGFLHPYLRSSPVVQRSATYWVHSGVNLLQ